MFAGIGNPTHIHALAERLHGSYGGLHFARSQSLSKTVNLKPRKKDRKKIPVSGSHMVEHYPVLIGAKPEHKVHLVIEAVGGRAGCCIFRPYLPLQWLLSEHHVESLSDCHDDVAA